MPTQINSDRFVWIDVETFGLVPESDPIIEIGIIITGLDLIPTADFNIPVWEPIMYDRKLEALQTRAKEGGDSYVLDMHRKSGLWIDAATNGYSLKEAAQELQAFMDTYGINRGDAMCGSSLRLDRNMLEFWFPRQAEQFSYRSIDVSTIKELCARWNPELFAKLPPAVETHRVMDCLPGTIDEARWYAREFLMTGDLVDFES